MKYYKKKKNKRHSLVDKDLILGHVQAVLRQALPLLEGDQLCGESLLEVLKRLLWKNEMHSTRWTVAAPDLESDGAATCMFEVYVNIGHLQFEVLQASQ